MAVYSTIIFDVKKMNLAYKFCPEQLNMGMYTENNFLLNAFVIAEFYLSLLETGVTSDFVEFFILP